MEYTDEWYPFKPFPFDKVKESEDEQDEEGVSETWIDDDEKEEGEIRREDEIQTNGDLPISMMADCRMGEILVASIGKPVAHEDPIEAMIADDPEAVESADVPLGGDIDENINGKNPSPEILVVVDIPQKENSVHIIDGEHVNPQPNYFTNCNMDIGALQKLVPLGVFGLFLSNPISPFSFKSPHAQIRISTPGENLKNGGPGRKKRKGDKSGNRNSNERKKICILARLLIQLLPWLLPPQYQLNPSPLS